MKIRPRGLFLSLILSLILGACSHADPGFQEPPTIESKDGVLQATLNAQIRRIEVGGVTVTTRVYNDLFVPPTLVVNPGDTMRIKLNNLIDEDTNLHYHGMNVSPLTPGDNVFLTIEPQQTFDYEVHVPADHPEGMFYYHPHLHGLTEFQIGSGMSGDLIVNGILDPFP